MSSLDRVPTYNLKAVVQETGLKPDTLRAWERRYGVPEPRRTSSGHRLYSQHDIDILKWLIARQEEGLSISRAVALWQRLEAENKDPLEAQPATPPGAGSPATASAVDDIPAGNQTVELRQTWVSACLAFDERLAEKILEQAFSLFSAETVCIEIVQKGLAEIGQGWHQGRITVQQEHFASVLAMRRIQALISTTPPPVRDERILIGCPPGEEHTFALMLLTLLLRRKGWPVISLGANVPLQNLEATVTAARPTLVLLIAQQLHTAATLLSMAHVLYERRIPLAYGGRIFNQHLEIQQCIPGYFLGTSIATAIQAVEQIMVSPRPKAVTRHVPQSYQEALSAFQEARVRVEADVWHILETTGIPSPTLADVNAFLGRNILAALRLCDIDYLQSDLEWFRGVLINHHRMPIDLVDRYLETYLFALESHLDARGQLILDWLRKTTGAKAADY